MLSLGIGATLASQYAATSADLTTVLLESSITGASYVAPPPGAPATLPFAMTPTNLAPGDITYSPLALRLAAGTARGATVIISSPMPTGSLTGLTYRLIQPSTFGCTESTTGTTLISHSNVGAVTGASTFAAPVGKPTSAAGAPVFLCFVITAGKGLVQAQMGTATWEFTAKSL